LRYLFTTGTVMALDIRDSATYVSFPRGISLGLLLDGMAGLASILAAVVILALIFVSFIQII
jgi:hypothetical protein